MSSPNLHILVNCTDRKSAPVPSDLRLGSIPSGPVEARAASWLRALATCRVERMPAEALYKGDHWAVVRSLPTVAEAARFLPSLWVVSAGYGLIRSTDHLRPYSVTFAAGHPDSVVSRGIDAAKRADLLRRWWHSLSLTKVLPGPRSIEQLVQRDNQAYFLVVCSPPYLTAIADDLKRAASIVHPDRLIIISSRLGLTGGPLDRFVIQSDARQLEALGGTRGTLNARVARLILKWVADHGFVPEILRANIEQEIAASPELRTYDRKRSEDGPVRDYISLQLQSSPSVSCSALLRKYRNDGKACEQHRFKNLYLEVKRCR